MINFTNVVLNDCVLCVLIVRETAGVSGGLDKNLFVLQSSIEALIQVVTISYLGITKALCGVCLGANDERGD